MYIIICRITNFIGFLFLATYTLVAQTTTIKALPPENITATSFEVRASATQMFSAPGYVFDVAYDSTFAENSFVPGFRRRRVLLNSSETTALISELNPATTYYFRFVEVETFAAAYTDKGFSNVQRVQTLDSPIPGSPDPRVSNITKNGFTLRWDPVPKADYYLVSIWGQSYLKDFINNTILTNKRVESTTFTIDNLRDTVIFNTILRDSLVFDSYRYSIRAANNAGIGLALTCGGCTCIHTQAFSLQSNGFFYISPPSGNKWTLDALPFGGLPPNGLQDSSYIGLQVRYSAPSSVLNEPDQERLIDTLWMETYYAIRNQLTCSGSGFNVPPDYYTLILHLKRKEDVQYFIQQYGRNAVRYTWNFVPSSPMFYRYSLTSSTTTGTAGQTDDALNLAITPNPSTDIAAFSLSLPSASALRLTLHDALGREVQSIADGVYAAGVQEFSVALQGLPSGVYFLRCSVGGQVVVRRLVVVR